MRLWPFYGPNNMSRQGFLAVFDFLGFVGYVFKISDK